MEPLVCKSVSIESIIFIFTILNCSPLILDSEVQLTYIIYKLRIDAVHLVDVRESVAAEIYIFFCKRSCSRL